MIGERLRLARLSARLSLRVLSDRIQNRVSPQAISKYERNEITPSSGVLAELSVALNVSADYLTGNPRIVLQSIDFRTKTITSKREQKHVSALVSHMLERYLAIEEMLGLPSVKWDVPRWAPYPVVSDVSEVERAANALRQDWGLGLSPIPNVAELLEDRGVKVFFHQPLDLDGLTAHVRLDGMPDAYVIVVNDSDWGERQRFTIAHEIGHMVLDVSQGIDMEKAANRFAGAFLMPEDVLWTKLGKRRSSIGWDELIDLKQVCGASFQAITYRCKDLGIISPTLMGQMFEKFADYGWRSHPYREAFARQSERSGRFARLCRRALWERALSTSRAAELLEVAECDLHQQMRNNPLITELTDDDERM